MRVLVDLWASTVQAYLDFRELCCVHQVSLADRKFCKALRIPLSFPTNCAHSSRFPQTPCLPDRCNKWLSTFEHCGASAFT